MSTPSDPTGPAPTGSAHAAAAHAASAPDRRSQRVLLLGSVELAAAIPLASVIDAVERGYRAAAEGATSESARVLVKHERSHTALNVMPALSEAAGATAVHVYSGGNRGVPAPQKVTLVFSTANGALEAVIESDWLSWARTGATGAVATRHLARADATVLGVIGTGRQAEAQVLAIAASRPLSAIYVYGRDVARRVAFAREMTALAGVEVVPLDRAEAVVERSDIVSTATTSAVPVFDAGALHPGLHINAIGAHRPTARELDAATVLASWLFVDDLVRSRQEDGEILLLPPAEREAALERSVPLGDVVAGSAPGRRSDAEITAFLSGGLSSEYLWTAVGVLEQARALGLGTLVPLG